MHYRGAQPGSHYKAFQKLSLPGNHSLRFHYYQGSLSTCRSPRLSHTSANGDPLISEFSLLCQALPILALWLYCFTGTPFTNRSLDLRLAQNTNPFCSHRSHNQPSHPAEIPKVMLLQKLPDPGCICPFIKLI